MKPQQPIVYQLDMFTEQKLKAMIHSEEREDVNGTQAGKERQLNGVSGQGRALAGSMMAQICSHQNIRFAYQRVKQNKGSSGIDQMAVDDFATWFKEHGDLLIESLLRGTYQPSPIRVVEIPKLNGGLRKLGIPTVTDRIIQQSIAQVLSPIYEPLFSNYSYGFRPKRNAHQALQQASVYVAEGKYRVVDMDLESFFDEVNHDRLMYQLSRRVKDKTLLRLIRKYLQSGVLIGGLEQQRQQGTPQGSPLSPLLSNIVLDELDKELERRGHSFVRYADDVSIYVRSEKASERVLESISCFIIDRLKLRINEQKSVICESDQTQLLGYTIHSDGTLDVGKLSQQRFKAKVRQLTKRNRGRALSKIISELNTYTRGWIQYFKHGGRVGVFRILDQWIRRKLRCYRIKQCKRVIGLYRFLRSLGIENWPSWKLALSGKGYWRKSSSVQSHMGMNLKWFESQSLFSVSLNHNLLNNKLKPPSTRVC